MSGNFLADNMKKTCLNACGYDISVDYRVFETGNIIDIHKYLMKQHDTKCLS